ncbi:MAG: TetR family transcriptional regulator [Elusimicrobia bacterium]|nr:TetR family transcriptional regulator [Elusimicrobiota bacterium]
MARPSRDQDRKLIDAARRMLPETGLSGLSVRAVARRARVNLGMFHYHFKTKRAFQRRVLQEAYEDFFAVFSAAAGGPGAPRERLRRLLVAVARFARDNRVLFTLLMREFLNAQPDVAAFAQENFPRHVAVLLGLLDECRREGSVRPLPPHALALFAMPAMGLPNIAVTAFERNRVRTLGGRPLAEFSAAVLGDAMIETRADMVLAALAPGRPA